MTTTTLSLNPDDFENVTKVLGPPPTEGPFVFTHDALVDPGQLQIETDDGQDAILVPLQEFDPVAGALLAAIAEYGVDAIQAVPGGFLIEQEDARLYVTYADNEAAIAAAESVGVPVNHMTDTSGEAFKEALAGAVLPHVPVHPETETEHGGEG